MNFIESVNGALDGIKAFFVECVEIVTSAMEALILFCDMLDELDARVVSMVDNCGSSEFVGLPINEAISTFRYVVGDVIFYLLYLAIMFGCLFTIWKLIMLIYSGLKNIKGSGGFLSPSSFASSFGKIFK